MKLFKEEENGQFIKAREADNIVFISLVDYTGKLIKDIMTIDEKGVGLYDLDGVRVPFPLDSDGYIRIEELWKDIILISM